MTEAITILDMKPTGHLKFKDRGSYIEIFHTWMGLGPKVLTGFIILYAGCVLVSFAGFLYRWATTGSFFPIQILFFGISIPFAMRMLYIIVREFLKNTLITVSPIKIIIYDKTIRGNSIREVLVSSIKNMKILYIQRIYQVCAITHSDKSIVIIRVSTEGEALFIAQEVNKYLDYNAATKAI